MTKIDAMLKYIEHVKQKVDQFDDCAYFFATYQGFYNNAEILDSLNLNFSEYAAISEEAYAILITLTKYNAFADVGLSSNKKVPEFFSFLEKRIKLLAFK